jgi:hypothetical protein
LWLLHLLLLLLLLVHQLSDQLLHCRSWLGCISTWSWLVRCNVL